MGLFYPTMLSGLPYVQPAYELALADIKRDYPCLEVSQSIITDPAYHFCTEYEVDSDRQLAEYYYRNVRRFDSADLVVFLQTLSGKLKTMILMAALF